MEEVLDLQMKIDDTNEVWDSAVDRINMAVTAKARANGIEKKDFAKKFEGKLLQMVKQFSSCKTCMSGAQCYIHKIKKKPVPVVKTPERKGLAYKPTGKVREYRAI